MSQKWMAALTAVGAAVMLTAMAIGSGPPVFLVGAVFCVVALLSLWSAKRAGRPTEFLYGGSVPKRWKWWTLLAALLATGYVLAAIGQLIHDPKATNVGALAIVGGFAALIVYGLMLRSRSRIAGNWMIIAGTAPALTLFWVIFPTVIGLAIIFGAVAEIARATPKAPLPA